jgi:hypothetical protein
MEMQVYYCLFSLDHSGYQRQIKMKYANNTTCATVLIDWYRSCTIREAVERGPVADAGRHEVLLFEENMSSSASRWASGD